MTFHKTLKFIHVAGFTLLLVYTSCSQKHGSIRSNNEKIPVILDTDTNNELDDQHALAYLIMNNDFFDIKGITVNATWSGGDIDNHYEEARRVVRLCGKEQDINIYKGANLSFTQISNDIDNVTFDGSEAVNFLINQASEFKSDKLNIIAVGKLTNIALAIRKDPSIAKHIRLLWLGSNYPLPGEYNLENDIPAMNYILDNDIEFGMAVCRYGDSTGTDAVRVTLEEIESRMPGLGPKITIPVEGRHGGEFYDFGDYSVSLFQHIKLDGDPPSRALFDMAAVSIVKNPGWAEHYTIPAPLMIEGQWLDRPLNKRKVVIWENFKRQTILDDFFHSFE